MAVTWLTVHRLSALTSALSSLAFTASRAAVFLYPSGLLWGSTRQCCSHIVKVMPPEPLSETQCHTQVKVISTRLSPDIVFDLLYRGSVHVKMVGDVKTWTMITSAHASQCLSPHPLAVTYVTRSHLASVATMFAEGRDAPGARGLLQVHEAYADTHRRHNEARDVLLQ